MTRLALALAALAALATPLAAQQAPALSLEHRMLLRCSAAFALVANRQAAGDPEALAHPPLARRGSEFFVRASARVIDEAGIDREAVAVLLRREAQELLADSALADTMPPCLAALEASGL
jgi:hypothetical protein